MKKYEFSHAGLNQAIKDRRTTLHLRKVLIVIGVIASISILNLPGASIVAFTTI